MNKNLITYAGRLLLVVVMVQGYYLYRISSHLEVLNNANYPTLNSNPVTDIQDNEFNNETVTVPDVRGEEISYQVGEVTLTGYLAYDTNKTEQRPGVLVVHEWWGHNEYTRTRADMLAKMGYTAFALDMYGDGKLATHPVDAQKFMMEVLNQADVAQQRFVAAYQLLQTHYTTLADKISAIGYCFGGAVVLQMARNGLDLKGVASFHGNLSTQAPASEGVVSAKILVLHGADDPFVPAEQIETFKQEMNEAKVSYQFIAYSGAVHSFTNPGATAIGEKFSLPLAYNKEADEQSWAELDSFLEQVYSSKFDNF